MTDEEEVPPESEPPAPGSPADPVSGPAPGHQASGPQGPGSGASGPQFPGAHPGPLPGPFQAAASDRVHAAWLGRSQTDYLFNYWSAFGWTVLTLGIYGFYVFYQLVRRMRDHNVRRLELFDASLTFAWERADALGLQEELTPSFQRAAAHVAVMRQMTTDFREPAAWLVLSIIARGIVEIVAFVLLDGDLIRHDHAEIGVEYELSLIYGRLGQSVPAPDQQRTKAPDNYVGRVIVSIVTLGIYLFWWYWNQMDVPNQHFQGNWLQEDALVGAVEALRPAAA